MKINPFILFCLIILINNVVHGNNLIGRSGSKEFYVISAAQNYHQGVQGCANLGMRIATPETQTEFDDLLRIYDSTGHTHAAGGQAYTGITKAGNCWGSYGYTKKWFPAEPSGDGICTELTRFGFECGIVIGLNDIPCEHLKSVICEKVIIPQAPCSESTAALTLCESVKATLAAEIKQHLIEIEAKTAKINQQTQYINYCKNILEE